MLFFRPRLNILIFFADFRLEIFLYYSIANDISVLEFIGVSITSVSYLDLYRVTLCLCSIAIRCRHFKPDTRNSIMETKVPNFVSTMSRAIKCYPCSKLFVNQQGLYLQMFQHTKLYQKSKSQPRLYS